MKQALNNGIKCNCKTTIRSIEDTDDKKETIQASFSFILYPKIFHYRLHHHRRFCYNQYKISINLPADI